MSHAIPYNNPVLFRNHDICFYYCRNCSCSVIGSTDTVCNVETGQCQCKTNADGLRCDSCKGDSFNLNAGNPDGCQKCFCYGHGTACVSAPGFTTDVVFSPKYDTPPCVSFVIDRRK